MKLSRDWKTYAIIILAVWNALLTSYLKSECDQKARIRKDNNIRANISIRNGASIVVDGIKYNYNQARKAGIITDDDVKDMEEYEARQSAIKNAE